MALELGARLFGLLASLAFYGMEGDKGGAFLGVGALIPQTMITEEHPSLFFFEVLVPPTVAYILGPSES